MAFVSPGRTPDEKTAELRNTPITRTHLLPSLVSVRWLHLPRPRRQGSCLFESIRHTSPLMLEHSRQKIIILNVISWGALRSVHVGFLLLKMYSVCLQGPVFDSPSHGQLLSTRYPGIPMGNFWWVVLVLRFFSQNFYLKITISWRTN